MHGRHGLSEVTINSRCRNGGTSAVIPMRSQNGVHQCVSPTPENHGALVLQAPSLGSALSVSRGDGLASDHEWTDHQASELLPRALWRRWAGSTHKGGLP